MNFISTRISAVALLGAVLAFPVYGEVAQRNSGSANSEAAAKAQTMVRQIGAERDALAAELEALKQSHKKELASRDAKIAALNKRFDGMRSALDHTDQSVQKYKEVNTALRERVLDAQDKMQKVIGKYKELVEALRITEDDRAQLQNTVTEKGGEIEACAQKNVKLYTVNLELLDRYEKKGVWDALLQKEPVTQLKRVEVENLVEDYRARIDEQKMSRVAN